MYTIGKKDSYDDIYVGVCNGYHIFARHRDTRSPWDWVDAYSGLIENRNGYILPNVSELMLIYDYANSVDFTGFKRDVYWTSYRNGDDAAVVDFDNSCTDYYPKDDKWNVRFIKRIPIRKLTCTMKRVRR